jgi:hypothetical protein
MAKAAKVETPQVVFLKNAPNIWKSAFFAALKPLTKLLTVEAEKVMQQAVSDITGKSIFNNLSNYTLFLQTIEIALNHAITDKAIVADNLRINKMKDGRYFFNLIGSNKSRVEFKQAGNQPQLTSFPGLADILANNPLATQKDIFAPLIAGMQFAGYDVQFSGNSAELVFKLPSDLIISQDEAGPSKSVSPTIGSIAGNIFPKDIKISTPAYKIECGATITFDTDVSGYSELYIDPFVEVTVTKDVYEGMVSAKDDKIKPFLAMSWMKNAIRASLATGGPKWNSLPAVDIRETSRLLGDVRKLHGKATPRLSPERFCIEDNGMPMYVPEVDLTDSYIGSITPETDAEGYYSFEDSLAQWANKVILVDWFNDMIQLTNSKGELKTEYLYGYVKLDKSSEYVFLNTPLDSSAGGGVKKLIKTMQTVINGLVTPEQATAMLHQDYSKPDSYNGGRVTQPFNLLFSNFVTGNTERLEFTDIGFRSENHTQVQIKHMLGQDLEELPDYKRGMAAQIHAYLKAMYSRRKELSIPVLDHLIGFEWLIQFAHNHQRYASVKEEGIKSRALKGQQPLLDVVDIPNVDAGGNLKGILPHQLKVLSNRLAGTTDGSLNVSAGGGKSIMLIAEILKKKERNPSWKPLVVTKSRLVKSFISEINFFTKGKVNVMSLRPRTIRVLRKRHKLNTFKEFADFVNKLPSNTIFITSYPALRSRAKLFPDLIMPTRVMLEDISLPQFLHVLRLIGFEQVMCDESHLIKNMKSMQSKFAYAVMAQAEEKVIASGTQISNTAMDLLGQGFSINPMVYGKNLDEFKERYGLSGGILDDEQAAKLRLRMKRFLQESVAYKEDWSFVLPDMIDKILYGVMTPIQAMFYNKLMSEAMVNLKNLMDGKKPPKEEEDPSAPKPEGGAGGEDDDSDEEDDDSDDDEEEMDEDEKFQQKVDQSLAKVEQFVVAPDLNPQFAAMVDPTPKSEDLVSPVVALIDAQFDRIFADKFADHSNNKAAVFGVHKVASRHFMMHSRYKDRAIHYTAGDEEAIRKFKTTPEIWILVADGTGLREGENLQMLSHTFMLQAQWAPGDHEQLVSRMYRPDPKGQYNKENVYNYWAQVKLPASKQPSVNNIKLARMISKSISAARFKYDGDPRWTRVAKEFEDLGLLKMSFDFLLSATEDDLAPFLDAWEGFVRWETSLNIINRKKVAEELEIANPGITLLDSTGRVIDRNLFTKLAMREVKSTKTIAGSKKAYTPWELGVTPADPNDLGLVVLGGQKIDVGTYVMTEYGPAIIHRPGKRMSLVEVYGNRKVSISNQTIGMVVGQDGKNKLAAIISNPTAWRDQALGPLEALQKLDPSASLAPKVKIAPTKTPPATVKPTDQPPPGIVPKNPPIGKPAIPVTKPTAVKPIKAPTKPIVEDIVTYLINGFPALVILDPPEIVYDHGWSHMDAFTMVTFKDWVACDKFLQAMAKKFWISGAQMEELNQEVDQFKTGKAMKLGQRVTESEVRQFFITNHKKMAKAKDGRDKVNPFFVAIGREVRLAFSDTSHSPTVKRWLKAIQVKNPTTIRKVTEVDEFAIQIFKTLTDAASKLKTLGELLDIPEADVRNELREMQTDIQELKGAKKKTM